MTTKRLKIFSLIFTSILLAGTIASTGLAFSKGSMTMTVMCFIMSLILSFLTFGDYVEWKQLEDGDPKWLKQ